MGVIALHTKERQQEGTNVRQNRWCTCQPTQLLPRRKETCRRTRLAESKCTKPRSGTVSLTSNTGSCATMTGTFAPRLDLTTGIGPRYVKTGGPSRVGLGGTESGSDAEARRDPGTTLDTVRVAALELALDESLREGVDSDSKRGRRRILRVALRSQSSNVDRGTSERASTAACSECSFARGLEKILRSKGNKRDAGFFDLSTSVVGPALRDCLYARQRANGDYDDRG
jgi:hypothetical protein